jgi:EmrB/QacA subfamily drug resistance transporter
MSDVISSERDTPYEPATGPSGLVVVLLCLAQFMVILDVTVVNVALPDIGRSLSLGREALTWVVAAYTLTFGGLLIVGGRLADAFGRKTMFLVGLGLFVLASVAAGTAGGSAVLLTGRVGQGVGAALLSPSALSILSTEFTGERRNRALGAWAAIGGGGAAMGVLVGGALAGGPGWRWVFFINVPVGILVALASRSAVPGRASTHGGPVDAPGALLGVASVALLIAGVISAGDAGWGALSVILPIVGAVLCAAAFVLVERRAARPLVSASVLRTGRLRGGVAMMLGATALLLAAFFLNSLYLQDTRRLSPMTTGLVFLPVAVAAVVGAHVSSMLVAKTSPKVLAAGGFVVAAAGLFLMATMGRTGNAYAVVTPRFVVLALGLGAVFVTATTSGLAELSESEAGVGSGILNTGHEIGGSLGIAIASTIAAANLTGAGGTSTTGFHHALFAGGIAAVVLAALAALVLPVAPPAPTDGPIRLH